MQETKRLSYQYDVPDRPQHASNFGTGFTALRKKEKQARLAVQGFNMTFPERTGNPWRAF